MATNEEMKTEYEIMSETWKFFKKYYGTIPDWDSIHTDAIAIEHKFNSKLCNDILVAYVMELERKVMKSVL